MESALSEIDSFPAFAEEQFQPIDETTLLSPHHKQLAPRILLRERSYSRVAILEAARILRHFGPPVTRRTGSPIGPAARTGAR